MNISTNQVVKRLLIYVKPYSKQAWFAMCMMIISAICSTYIVHSVKPIVDQLFLAKDSQKLLIIPLVLIVTYCVKAIVDYYQTYLFQFIGQKILTDLQMQMYEHLLSADLSFIQSQSSGHLISRFTSDISVMRGAVSHLLIRCIKSFLSLLFLTILMLKLEPILSCVIFVMFPLAIYPIQKLGDKIRKTSGQAQGELDNYTTKLNETLQSIKIIKSFTSEKIESNRAMIIANNILNFYKKTTKLDAMISPIMEISTGLAIATFTWYGGLLIIAGTTTPGTIVAFITAFGAVYRPFKSLMSVKTHLQVGVAAAIRVFNILDTKAKVKDHISAKHINFIKPEIIFKNVQLKFNNKVVLRRINLKLEQGKITVLVGPSGSGKTSLANLLVRFYDPSKGQILINGHNIKNIKITSLRQQISLVTQEVTLFNVSVAQNIAYGNPSSTREQIITAAKYADAHEFISDLPQGYDTIIGTNSFILSSGQCQRLSIARAFLKDAPILIWDEATSSLDRDIVQSILNSLTKFRAGKTTLIITHCLSNVIGIDNIIMIKSGLTFEQGTANNFI